MARRAVYFDAFSSQCPFFNSDVEANNGYGCDHSMQREVQERRGKEQGCCYCFSCPLGTEVEEDDFIGGPDAVSDWKEIDWDGTEQKDFEEHGYLLVNIGEDATQEEKDALWNYDLYMHRYDKEWLDENNIPNTLC